MSNRGKSNDNAMAENFFSILKEACIPRHKPATFSEANEMIDRYIHCYSQECIQLKNQFPPSEGLFVLAAQAGAVMTRHWPETGG